MKTLLFLLLTFICAGLQAQTIQRPDVCAACVEDTTGGYISIVDTLKHNPICNYEFLTKVHLDTVHILKIDRAGIPFFPHWMDNCYNGSGFSRGHVIPYEDLAWSQATATASMNELRNLAPEGQAQNVGTELQTENLERTLATADGWVKVYCGTYGSIGTITQATKKHGTITINEPAFYWKLIIEPNGTKHLFWMPTTGDKSVVGYGSAIELQSTDFSNYLPFDPEKVIGN